MIALALTLLAADPPVLEAIGRQALPAKGCAAYLWDGGQPRRLVAMAVAEPGLLRVKLDGRVVDVARAGAEGAAGFGFSGVTTYRGADLLAVLDMSVETRRDLQGGGVVPAGTLRVERPGRDVLVQPVQGLIGCGG